MRKQDLKFFFRTFFHCFSSTITVHLEYVSTFKLYTHRCMCLMQHICELRKSGEKQKKKKKKQKQKQKKPALTDHVLLSCMCMYLSLCLTRFTIWSAQKNFLSTLKWMGVTRCVFGSQLVLGENFLFLLLIFPVLSSFSYCRMKIHI